MLRTLKQAAALVGHDHRWRWVFLTALAVVVGLLEAIGALLILGLLAVVTGESETLDLPGLGSLQDRFPGLETNDLFKVAALIVGAFFLLRGVGYLGQTYLRNKLAHDAGTRIATQLFRGYLRAPYSLHLRRNSAELIRNLHSSTYELVDNILVPIVGLASEGLLILAVLVILVATAPVATLLTIAILGPVVLVLMRLVQPRLVRLGGESQELNRVNIQTMQQSFQGLREIKILQKESFFEGIFAESRASAARAYYVRSFLLDAPRVIVETTLILFILGFLVVASGDAGSAQETLPVLGLFAYAALRILPSVNRILAFANTLRFGTAAVDILAQEMPIIQSALEATEVATEVVSFGGSIDVNDVSFRYEGTDTDVVKNVNLTIPPGSSLGIVGATGSGKSTLVDLILGLLDPTEGHITVAGKDIHDDLASWHSRIGMVPQTIFLLDDTVRMNIAFGVDRSEIDEERLRTAVSVAQLDAFIATLPEGLETIVGERGVRLSGGQRQRIAIARALYTAPALIVMDEGTSALDDATESELMDALDRMREGHTHIMIAHRVTTVRKCDQVILMRDGVVQDSGTYEELTKRHSTLR